MVIARFGSWTFDGRRRQVFRGNGEVLHLTPKAFDLLGILLEQAPSVVRKNELHERLWPGTFVSDATLVGLVKELRRSLNDRNRHLPVIRTSYGVGYAFCAPIDRAPAAELDKAPSSIAVLPFVNLSAESHNDYFGEGLTEELINALTQLRGLRVASRTSVFQFRNSSVNITEVGRQLRVSQVLEGSIQRAGNRLRITARLVNVADGYHLWSRRFERELTGIFEIQDEMTASIVTALEPALVRRPRSVADRHTSNVEAFELYLRARYHWHQRTPESLQTAIGHLEAAIRLDPDYALALAGRADAYSILAFYGYLPLHDARAASDQSSRRALELAPDLPETHYARALFTMWLSSQWREAEGSFRQALEIQPDFAPAHTHYAAFLSISNRLDEARAHILEAVTLDPLSPAVYGTGALCMFTSGQYAEAVRYGTRALELHPNFAVGLYALGLTHCRLQQFERACDAFERLLTLSNRATYFLGWKALAHGLAGQVDEAIALAGEIAGRHPGEYTHPLTHVLVARARADRGAAASAVRAYIAAGGAGFQMGHIVPFFGDWRSDPDFLELFEQLCLELS